MRAGYWAAVVLLVGGCTSEETWSSWVAPRIPQELRLDLHHPTPVFPSDGPVADGGYRVEIDPGDESMSARFEIWHYTSEGIRFELVAHRDTDATGLETRYLTEEDFKDATARLLLDGVEYVGATQVFDVELDLFYGIAYGEVVIRFESARSQGDGIDLGMDFAGYIDSFCSRTDDNGRAITSMYVRPGNPPWTRDDDDPAACVALFEALRATPDDPSGPPPPYSLDDTPSGGPVSTPVADAG